MTRAELRWALGWALAVMLITCLPYLYVAHFAPPGSSFSGLLSMIDDHCVYLSWEQQAAQGHFLLRNLFTGDAQRGIYIHLLSWAIGTVARFTGLPLILVHHGARFLSGTLLLLLVYALAARFTAEVTTRRAAFWFTALSSGLGSLLVTSGMGESQPSVDLWQPEAITFQCLYVNGLFCVALALMVGFFLLMLGAQERQGGARWRRVAGAGVLALLLGNIHSYDVITLAAVWGAYLVARTVTARVRGPVSGVSGQGSRVRSCPTPDPRPLTPGPHPFSPVRELVNALVAGLLALPATAYQYYLYRTEPVFRLRADSQTATPSIVYYLEGYGVVLLLAIAGLLFVIGEARRRGEPLGERMLPVMWAVVGFALPFVPCAFQRKLVMGLHLPLAFLAAVGAVALARRAARTTLDARRSTLGSGRDQSGVVRPRRASSVERRASFAQAAIVAGLLLLTVPTNVFSTRFDVACALAPIADAGQVPTFLSGRDIGPLAWARERLPRDGVTLCAAPAALLLPALAGRTVYAGHWSETPHAPERMRDCLAFYREPSAERRRAFLAQRGIRYVYLGPSERRVGQPDLAGDSHFRKLYATAGTEIYELLPTSTAAAADAGPRRLTSRHLD